MAKNRKLAKAQELPLPVPSGTESGQPVAVGQIPAVALTNRDANGNATCQRDGSYLLSVKGENGSGGSAVAVGDIIYIEPTARTLSKIATGVRFGYALGAVNSAATVVIEVAIGY